MSTVYRANRKATDADIIRLNSVGLTLATIAHVLNCHPTTITLRLRSLKIKPADTRRSFMEDIFMKLNTSQQEWLADQVTNSSIKEYVEKLIIEKYNSSQNQGTNNGSPQSLP